MKTEIETALSHINEFVSSRLKQKKPELSLEWVEAIANLEMMNKIIITIAEQADVDPNIILKRISRRAKRHHSKNEFEEAIQLGLDLCGESFEKEIINLSNNLL